MHKMQIGLVMACMTTLGYMMGGGFSSVEQHTTSQGEGFPIFEVEVAKPFPVVPLKNFNIATDSPITNFRVPLEIDTDSKLSFVSDYEVTIDNGSGLVGRVKVERGFISKSECISALGYLVDKFQEYYPAFQIEAGKSSYSKTVGDLRVGASCLVYESSPYVSLEYYFESNSVADNILKAFTRG